MTINLHPASRTLADSLIFQATNNGIQLNNLPEIISEETAIAWINNLLKLFGSDCDTTKIFNEVIEEYGNQFGAYNSQESNKAKTEMYAQALEAIKKSLEPKTVYLKIQKGEHPINYRECNHYVWIDITTREPAIFPWATSKKEAMSQIQFSINKSFTVVEDPN